MITHANDINPQNTKVFCFDFIRNFTGSFTNNLDLFNQRLLATSFFRFRPSALSPGRIPSPKGNYSPNRGFVYLYTSIKSLRRQGARF